MKVQVYFFKEPEVVMIIKNNRISNKHSLLYMI
jgi:hypothetical protein